MAFIIGVVSQKGGVGKSTIARLIAREMAAQEWQVKIADLDVSQATTYDWRSRRLDQALKIAAHYDLLVLDGAPHATQATKQIADASDLVIIPTGLALDDLRPGVRLAHDFVKARIAPQKIVFALCRVGHSQRETAEARDYLATAGYTVLAGALPEQTAYRQASDEGRAPTETRFASLNKHAETLAQSIVDTMAALSKQETA